MTNRRLWIFRITLACLTFANPGTGLAQLQIEATVNAQRIGMEDELELTVSIRGDAMGRAGNPTLRRLEGFRTGGQSTSTSIQFINGQMSSTRTVIYRLIPRSEGKHIIGAISVDYQGKEYLTEPIEVEVVSGSVLPRAGRGGLGGGIDPLDPFNMFSGRRRQQRRPVQEGEVFVSAEFSQPEAYIGEQVILTYTLYSQVQIMGLQVDQQPTLTGFWVEEVELPDEPKIRETTVNHKRFFVVEIKKSILFPTKAGPVTVEPAVFSMAVRDTSGDPFFGRLSQSIRRATKAISLEVKPLPTAGRPPGFSGAVGRFELSVELDKEEMPAGEPVTLTVALRGEGNLRTVETPELPPLAGFRTYDPKIEENLSAKSSGFGGEKKWQYVLVPDSAGEHRIDPLLFSYFDPSKQRYVELRAGPLTLDVAPSSTVAGGPAITSRGRVKLLRQDIRYLKPAPEAFGVAGSPFYRSGLFYASLALPLLWNLGLIVYRRKQQSEAAHAGMWRARRAQKMAQGRLKQAQKKARTASMDFYEETAGALYRYVADKLGVSPSGLTSQSIQAMLEEHDIPESLGLAYIKTLEACEFARFTPGERSGAEMEKLLDRAEKIIVSLEKHFE